MHVVISEQQFQKWSRFTSLEYTMRGNNNIQKRPNKSPGTNLIHTVMGSWWSCAFLIDTNNTQRHHNANVQYADLSLQIDKQMSHNVAQCALPVRTSASDL